jgi:hypothetical protein
VYLRVGQDLAKLLAHPFLQLVFVEVDSILNEAAGFDVTVEEDHFVTSLGQFSDAIGAGRPGADRHYQMSALDFGFSHNVSQL